MQTALLPAPAKLNRLLSEAGFEVVLSLRRRDGLEVSADDLAQLADVLAQLNAVDERNEALLRRVAALWGDPELVSRLRDG